jgi:hypothetical protein
MINEAVALWAVREVAVQWDEIEDVEPLYEAYLWFSTIYEGTLNSDLLIELGYRAKPSVNLRTRFRSVNVAVGGDVCPSWQRVPELIGRLCESWSDGLLTPTDLFVEFERIHPFRDGNGRSGAVLANVVAGRPDDKLALSWEIYSFRTRESVWGS